MRALVLIPRQSALVRSFDRYLARSERAGEVQDYLAYLDSLILGKQTPNEMLNAWRVGSEPHLKKAYARIYDEIIDFNGYGERNDGVR